VQRLAPRLVNTLDKAIGFAQSVLDYGRQSATPPKPERVSLKALAEDAAFDAGLVGHPTIGFANAVPDWMEAIVDGGQMTRVRDCRRGPRKTCSSPSRARRAPAEPGLGSPSRAN
jgi:hypothetical protein